ncbi:MAG: hypothetical protein IJW79_10150 [Clostridia bacterium]|nr:hypothetical protein [Clostridia bacterium]
MFLFILICVLVFAVVIAFLIWLLVFRNKVIDYQERIKEAKSRVRVEKSTMGRTSRAIHVGQTFGEPFGGYTTTGIYGARVNNVGFVQGDMGKASIYNKSTDTVTSLSQSVERAQYDLNKLISNYNRYISVFPNVIMAAILKCKKEEYLDEGNMKKSTALD